MNFIDMKYINVLSGRLERFKIKSHRPYRANFRCPVCGDSQKSDSKARGWILEKDHEHTVYYCHNCSCSWSLRYFIKYLDPTLYNEYLVERKLDNMTPGIEPEKFNFTVPKFRKNNSPLIKIKKISQLHHDHPAKKYITDRQIPSGQHYRIYYAPKFVEWTNSIIPDKLSQKEHPRIILPMIDKEENFFGYQGRSLDPNDKVRYITIIIDDTKPKIFGLNAVDFNKKYYIVEGPIDSLFLDNAIAMVGSDFHSDLLRNITNAVVVYDNEPRNPEIVKKISRVINAKWKVCLWPEQVKQKDINDMVLNGLNPQSIIDTNTYSGLEAEMKFTQWRKI